MPRLTRIYTRAGDGGTTRLGNGTRVDKDSLRVTAYGTVDELNAQIGVALAAGLVDEVAQPLRRIQNDLFHVGAELCVPEPAKVKKPGPKIEQRHVDALEKLIDELNRALPALENFVLPGGNIAAAHLQMARTVCRRAERAVVRLARAEPIATHLIPYLNRLSDVLFVMARYQNKAVGADEPIWDSRA